MVERKGQSPTAKDTSSREHIIEGDMIDGEGFPETREIPSLEAHQGPMQGADPPAATYDAQIRAPSLELRH